MRIIELNLEDGLGIVPAVVRDEDVDRLSRFMKEAMAAITGNQAIPDEPEHWTQYINDHNRLVRELDVLLNGEAGAAQQASLCDIVTQVAVMKRIQKLEADPLVKAALDEAGKSDEPVPSQREKFEKWFKDRYDPLVTTIVGSQMDEKWDAWQAALSAAPDNELREAASQAHSLLADLMADATGDEEKEIYRVFDLLRYRLGIYDKMHPLSVAPTPPEVEAALYVNSQALEREKYPSTKIERDEYYDTPLFTRPPAPNDELMAAAKDVVKFLTSVQNATYINPVNLIFPIESHIRSLKSALGKKEGE